MYRKFIKRLFDIIFALFCIPFFVIIFIILAPIIYLEDRGSVFYCANRLGRNGKVFNMYKFRSMKMNAPDIRNKDRSTFNAEDDPRLTRIGKIIRKTSLDETPQILNVIKGDMSIIGPRPDLPEAINHYQGDEILKISVRPGITGYSQAHFRNSISTVDKFKNDVFYVKNLNLFLDLRIIYVTVINGLKLKNIHNVNVKRK